MNRAFILLYISCFFVMYSFFALADPAIFDGNAMQSKGNAKNNNPLSVTNAQSGSNNLSINLDSKKDADVNSLKNNSSNNINPNFNNVKNIVTNDVVVDGSVVKDVNANINLSDIKNVDIKDKSISATNNLQNNNVNALPDKKGNISNKLNDSSSSANSSFVNNVSNTKTEVNNFVAKDYIGNVDAPLSWNGKSFGSDSSNDSGNSNDSTNKVVSNVSQAPISPSGFVGVKQNIKDYSDHSNTSQTALKDAQSINNNISMHGKVNEVAIDSSKSFSQGKNNITSSTVNDSIKYPTKDKNQKFNISDLKKSYEDMQEIKEIDNYVDWGDYITIKNKKIIPEAIKEEVSPLVYKKSYSIENAHMPIAIYESDYRIMLFDAIKQHDSLAVSYLIDMVGVDIKMEGTGDTPLTFAIKYGDEQSLKTILLKGCSITEKDFNGESALDIAKRLDKKSFENIIVGMIVD